MTEHYTQQPETAIRITEAERWALTKATLIGLRAQNAFFTADDQQTGIFEFPQTEFEALKTALEKLCPIRTEIQVQQ